MRAVAGAGAAATGCRRRGCRGEGRGRAFFHLAASRTIDRPGERLGFIRLGCIGRQCIGEAHIAGGTMRPSRGGGSWSALLTARESANAASCRRGRAGFVAPPAGGMALCHGKAARPRQALIRHVTDNRCARARRRQRKSRAGGRSRSAATGCGAGWGAGAAAGHARSGPRARSRHHHRHSRRLRPRPRRGVRRPATARGICSSTSEATCASRWRPERPPSTTARIWRPSPSLRSAG